MARVLVHCTCVHAAALCSGVPRAGLRAERSDGEQVAWALSQEWECGRCGGRRMSGAQGSDELTAWVGRRRGEREPREGRLRGELAGVREGDVVSW